ncbi:MAG: GNAT family N-acetyltransferase [Burkholderiales bacterium]
MSASITALRAQEVDELCALAREVWQAHYPPIIGLAQTEYMLRQRYDPEVIRKELASGAISWDVLRERGAMRGFASCFPAEPPRTLKLDKLYVHPEHQRRGLGASLLRHVCDRARGEGYETVILAVNKRNATAITAYRKYGFTIAEAVVKDIGGGFVMDDYVMEIPLREAGSEEAGGERSEE